MRSRDGSLTKFSARITKLRLFLYELGIDSYILPLGPHNNITGGFRHLDRFKWLSGFTGDSGLFILTSDKLVFFTNGIYIDQARDEIEYFDHVFDLRELKPQDWLCNTDNKIALLGYDDDLWTEAQLQSYKQIDISLHVLSVNPIDKIMGCQIPVNPIKDFPLEYAGISMLDKVAQVSSALPYNNYLFSAADSIAWLLNLRGHDGPYVPLFFAELLLSKCMDGAIKIVLFVESPDHVHTNDSGIDLQPFSAISGYLAGLEGDSLAYDPSFTTIKLSNLIRQHRINVVHLPDPCQKLKAIKNDIEIKGFINAHVRDGAAVINFLHWFDLRKNETITEMDCVSKINALRQEQPLFQFNSFPVIAGFNPNAAIIHYNPSDFTNLEIAGDGMLLLDSGGHYLDGTTDITRTIACGSPTQYQRLLYTLVLKGHLAAQNLIFPKGTTGKQIDSIARQFLWRHSLNYDHGTGHGVGHFSSVHEFPPSMSSDIVLEAGMVMSIEPGVYISGQVGVRIENLVLVINHDERYLRFKPLTLVPYDKRLIDHTMITSEERKNIVSYHGQIVHTMRNVLEGRTMRWLEDFARF